MRKVFLLFCLMLLTVATVNAQTVNVTFQADMRVAMATGYFDPATDTLTCPGDFNNWLSTPPDNTEKIMTDDNNDSVYTITIAVTPNSTYGYKFNIGMGWDGKDENQGNRSVDVGASDMTLDPCFFNNYTPYTGIQSPVTFNVDMSVIAQSTFDPSTQHVYVAGNFTNWGTDAIEMTNDNPGVDTIYSVTVDVDSVLSGDLLIYKFIYGSDPSSGSWEYPEKGDDWFGNDHNRIIGVVDGSNSVSWYWNNDDGSEPVVTGDGNIYFDVDMSVAEELGVFNPDKDSVQIRGDFNGWNASDPPRSLLNQDAADPDHWYLDVSFTNYILNSLHRYKFFNTDTNYTNTGWEVYLGPTDNGDRNRVVTFEGSDTQTQPLAYFEGIHPDWVIPSGTTVECTFSVDMTNATIADTQGTKAVFNPATDTVYWVPRNPLFYAVHGLVWTAASGFVPARILELTDPDQDMVYTGTLTLNGPDFNGFLYNYGFTSGGTLVQEGKQGDITQGDARVRFIGQTGARMFVSPWNMPQDVWDNNPGPEEEGPVLSVRDLPGNPIKYSLSQNYPNPFNPTTMIRFSIPEAGQVTLKVYNLLGEEVATLVNKEMKSGSYEVDFKGANYSSGIYLYTITANNYTATKKMILLK